MRSRIAIVGAAVAVLALGGAGVAVAAGHQSSTGSSTTFTVVEHAVTDTTTDTGAKGDSVGDILTFHNPVYDAANKGQIGVDNGSCLRTKKGYSYECTWTTKLAGGSLVVEGPFYDAYDSVLAITGGTGDFAGAHGGMTLHARNAAGSSYDFTFRVRQS